MAGNYSKHDQNNTCMEDFFVVLSANFVVGPASSELNDIPVRGYFFHIIQKNIDSLSP